MAIAYYDLHNGSATALAIRFVLGALATWRITHMLVSEDGPWEIFARLRGWLGASAIGRVMGCFGCVSIWVAAPISFFLIRALPDLFFCWLAVSGAAFLLERLHPEPVVIERLSEAGLSGTGQDEVTHGMLR